MRHPFAFDRGIYSVERKKSVTVKKITLSERSELGIFKERTTEAKVQQKNQ